MYIFTYIYIGFPDSSDGKESACNAGDPGSIPGLEKSPGEGNGSPLQYSCLEDSTDKGTCWATVHEVTKSRTQLSLHIWEKVMAPHSSTLAWKIPWMEEPGRLQSMGSLRVGHA